MNASFSCNKQLKFARGFGSRAFMSTYHLSKSCVHGANLIHNSRCALLSSSLPLKSKPAWHIWKIKYQLECGGVCVCAAGFCCATVGSRHCFAFDVFYAMLSPTYKFAHFKQYFALVAMHRRWVGNCYASLVGWIARHDNDDNSGRPHSHTNDLFCCIHERVNSAYYRTFGSCIMSVHRLV